MEFICVSVRTWLDALAADWVREDAVMMVLECVLHAWRNVRSKRACNEIANGVGAGPKKA